MGGAGEVGRKAGLTGWGRWGRLSEATGIKPPKPKPDFATENTEIAEGDFDRIHRIYRMGTGTGANCELRE